MHRLIQETESELLARVVVKAWTDAAYRDRLLREPREVLEEAGLSFEDGTSVHIHAESPSSRHFVLPTPPPESSLEEGDLQLVAHDRLSAHLELF